MPFFMISGSVDSIINELYQPEIAKEFLRSSFQDPATVLDATQKVFNALKVDIHRTNYLANTDTDLETLVGCWFGSSLSAFIQGQLDGRFYTGCIPAFKNFWVRPFLLKTENHALQAKDFSKNSIKFGFSYLAKANDQSEEEPASFSMLYRNGVFMLFIVKNPNQDTRSITLIISPELLPKYLQDPSVRASSGLTVSVVPQFADFKWDLLIRNPMVSEILSLIFSDTGCCEPCLRVLADAEMFDRSVVKKNPRENYPKSYFDLNSILFTMKKIKKAFPIMGNQKAENQSKAVLLRSKENFLKILKTYQDFIAKIDRDGDETGSFLQELADCCQIIVDGPSAVAVERAFLILGTQYPCWLSLANVFKDQESIESFSPQVTLELLGILKEYLPWVIEVYGRDGSDSHVVKNDISKVSHKLSVIDSLYRSIFSQLQNNRDFRVNLERLKNFLPKADFLGDKDIKLEVLWHFYFFYQLETDSDLSIVTAVLVLMSVYYFCWRSFIDEQLIEEEDKQAFLKVLEILKESLPWVVEKEGEGLRFSLNPKVHQEDHMKCRTYLPACIKLFSKELLCDERFRENLRMLKDGILSSLGSPMLNNILESVYSHCISLVDGDGVSQSKSALTLSVRYYDWQKEVATLRETIREELLSARAETERLFAKIKLLESKKEQADALVNDLHMSDEEAQKAEKEIQELSYLLEDLRKFQDISKRLLLLQGEVDGAVIAKETTEKVINKLKASINETAESVPVMAEESEKLVSAKLELGTVIDNIQIMQERLDVMRNDKEAAQQSMMRTGMDQEAIEKIKKVSGEIGVFEKSLEEAKQRKEDIENDIERLSFADHQYCLDRAKESLASKTRYMENTQAALVVVQQEMKDIERISTIDRIKNMSKEDEEKTTDRLQTCLILVGKIRKAKSAVCIATEDLKSANMGLIAALTKESMSAAQLAVFQLTELNLKEVFESLLGQLKQLLPWLVECDAGLPRVVFNESLPQQKEHLLLRVSSLPSIFNDRKAQNSDKPGVVVETVFRARSASS